MSFFRKKEQPSHLLYPDILHWKEGDEIKARNANITGPFSKLMAFETGKLNLIYLYKGLTDDGFIIVEEKDNGQLHKVNFRRFLKHAKNISFKNRAIEQDLDQSKNYMELIDEFQKAYTELQDGDKDQKLLT
ncbi:MAG: hypothetical protein RLN81_05115 [Balneolaceae bacterium]